MPKKSTSKKARPGAKRAIAGESFRAMPLYHQSYLVIRQRLREGVYPLNQPLPSEEDIRQEFGVSRVTIRRALAELEAEGLIQRRRGSGTYPIEQPADSEARANISGLYENLITLGLNTEARVLNFETIAAPNFLLRQDERFAGDVLHIERVRLLDGEPFSCMESYLPGALAKHFKADELGNHPLLMTLELAGITVGTAEQTLTASAADAKVAEVLDVPIGAPLIQMNRLSLDTKQQPIEFFVSYYRPDRFEYRMTLSRVQGGEAPRWMPVS
jgi:GntR family transcriptional regulator